MITTGAFSDPPTAESLSQLTGVSPREAQALIDFARRLAFMRWLHERLIQRLQTLNALLSSDRETAVIREQMRMVDKEVRTLELILQYVIDTAEESHTPDWMREHVLAFAVEN